MSRAPTSALVLLLVSVALIACDDGNDGEESPTQTHTPTVTATFSPSGALAVSPPFAGTPEPTPTPLGEAYRTTATGWVVFLRDDDLRIARLDGSEERALTGRGTGGGFAGVATHADGTRWLYFTEVRGTHDEPMFAVLRQLLDGGVTAELFAAAGRAFETYRDANAAISRDARTLLYPDANGIVRRDLATGVETRVIDDYLTCPAVTGCYRHRAPRWSPDNDEISVQRFYYEGARAVLLDAAAPKAEERVLLGHTAEWSPDGTMLCALDDFYAGVERLVIIGENREPLYERAIAPGLGSFRWSPSGCAWDSNGERVATAYSTAGPDCAGSCARRGIAVLSAASEVIADLVLPNQSGYRVISWLQGEDAILFSSFEVRRETLNLVITLDGRTAPFAIPYGQILAVIDD